MAKQYFELTFDEKIALYRRDPKAFHALRDAGTTFRGKSWDELSREEKASLYRENHAQFMAMRPEGEFRYGR